jgi:transposase
MCCAQRVRSFQKTQFVHDALGNPLRFLLTPGQAHDLTGADALLPDMAATLLIADRAFDADTRVLRPLAAADKSAVIPTPAKSPYTAPI